jgi:hypothetical protein
MAVTKFTDNDSDPAKVGTQYTVRNPHPGFEAGDPNIMNEYGHTHYPKCVDHPTKKRIDFTQTFIGRDQRVTNRIVNDGLEGRPDIPEQVVVNSKEEHDALLAGQEVPKKKSKGWDK